MIYQYIKLFIVMCSVFIGLFCYMQFSAKFLSDNTLKTNIKEMILEVEYLNGYKKVHPSNSTFFDYSKRDGEAIPVEVPNYLRAILNTEMMQRYKKLTGKESSKSEKLKFVTSNEVKQRIIEFNNKVAKEIAYLEPPDSGFSRHPFHIKTFYLNHSLSFLLSKQLIENGDYMRGLSIISSLLATCRAISEFRGFENLPTEYTLYEMVVMGANAKVLKYLLKTVSKKDFNKSPFSEEIIRNITWFVERDSFREIIDWNLNLPVTQYRSGMEDIVYSFDEHMRSVFAIYPKEFNWKFFEMFIIRVLSLLKEHYKQVLDLYLSEDEDTAAKIKNLYDNKYQDAEENFEDFTPASSTLVAFCYFLSPEYYRNNYMLDTFSPIYSMYFIPNLPDAYEVTKKAQLTEEKALKRFGQ